MMGTSGIGIGFVFAIILSILMLGGAIFMVRWLLDWNGRRELFPEGSALDPMREKGSSGITDFLNQILPRQYQERGASLPDEYRRKISQWSAEGYDVSELVMKLLEAKEDKEFKSKGCC
jgi:hypothetical protein